METLACLIGAYLDVMFAMKHVSCCTRIRVGVRVRVCWIRVRVRVCWLNFLCLAMSNF